MRLQTYRNVYVNAYVHTFHRVCNLAFVMEHNGDSPDLHTTLIVNMVVHLVVPIFNESNTGGARKIGIAIQTRIYVL